MAGRSVFWVLSGWLVGFSWGELGGANLTLNSAVERVRTENLDLRAARVSIQEAVARRGQRGRLTNPELEVELRPNLNGREGVAAFSFTQRLPLTDRLRRERAVGEAGIAAAQAEVAEYERQLAQEAALLGVEILGIDALIAAHTEQQTHYREWSEEIRTAGKAGEASPWEQAQAELSVGNQKGVIQGLVRDRSVPLGRFRQLLNLPVNESVHWQENLAELASRRDFAMDRPTVRPDVQWAEARREEAQREVALARAQRWQDVGVGLVSELQRAEDLPIGRLNDQFVGVRVALPLPIWNRGRARLREAQVAVERFTQQQLAQTQKALQEQSAAEERVREAFKVVEQVRLEQLPAAEKLATELTQARRVGQASYVELARAQEQALQSRASLVIAQREHLRARVLCQFAYGHPLPFSVKP